MHFSHQQVFFAFLGFLVQNCVNGTFRRKQKNFELYLFLLFGNCRSGFLVDGPAFSMSISFFNFFFYSELKTAIEI